MEQIFFLFFPLDLRLVPQANICPLFLRNESVCSEILYFSLLISSISTPLFKRKIFTIWFSFNALLPNLNAFQTVSGSFVPIIIPIFKLNHLHISFFISSYSFFVISPEAYLLLSIARES